MNFLAVLAIGADIVMVFGLAAFFTQANSWFGPKPCHEGDADAPYESGELPFGQAARAMSVLYHRFAVLFVVFDVDLAFLLPWALCRRVLNAELAAAVSVFVALLGFMLVYFWRKGVLECR